MTSTENTPPPSETSDKRPVGRPALLKGLMTRNILISDELVEVAIKLSPDSISAGVRSALLNADKFPVEAETDFSRKSLDAQFVNAKQRHIVLDAVTYEIALKVGRGNISAGVRNALQRLLPSLTP